MVLGCDHIGIQVRDVERSASFYEDMLGFHREARWSNSEPFVQRVVGYPGATLEIALLRIPGSPVRLEILEYRGVDKTPVDPATANPGTAHICLSVANLDELYAQLQAKNVQFLSTVQTATAGPVKASKVIYLLDPDGIRVELVELKPAVNPTTL